MDAGSTRVRRLANDRYDLRLDALGRTRSAFDGYLLAGAEYPARAGGAVIYIRDLDRGTFWTTGLLPGRRRPERYDAWLDAQAPTLLRHDDGVETLTRLTLGDSAPVELRRVTLTNRGEGRRRLEITTYVPLALDHAEAFAGHPAFSRLFIETDSVPGIGGLLARRRPRNPGDPALSAVHLLVPDEETGDEDDPERETDRARFIGRGRTAAAPAALASAGALRGTLGGVLDPTLCLRRAATLEPGEATSFTFVLGAGSCPEDARAAVSPFASARACRRSFPAAGRDPTGPSEGPAALARFGPSTAEGMGLASSLPGANDTPLTNPDVLRFFNGHGGFNEAGDEYVVLLGSGPDRLRRPPQPWINVVANPRIGFIASESGGGCTWVGNSRLNRLTPWYNDPISDPHGEAVFLRDEEDGAFWSPLPGPAPGAGPYEARHGFGYSRYRHRSKGLDQEVWQVVAPEAPVKLVRARVSNRSGRPRRLSAFAYFEWVLGGDAVARRRVEAAVAGDAPVVFARNPGNEDFGDALAFAAVVPPRAGAPVAASADRLAFVGPRGDLSSPTFLRSGDDLEAGEGRGDNACAVLQARLEVAPGETAEVVFLLGEAGSEAEARSLIAAVPDAAATDAVVREVVDGWRALLGRVRVATPSPALDLMLNGWLLYQNVSCRLLGRSALYQSGGAFGFRDQLQDAAALVYADPGATRRQILLHAAHQFPEGDVLHWWHPPADRGIRTRFSDDLLWLPYITGFYLDVTGDGTLLDEAAAFVEGPQLEPGEDERYLRVAPSAEAANVYEHCCRAIDRSLTRGAHGLPLMGSGDWNDGMNRVGRLGRGESVWLGFFLADILQRWIPLCEARGDAERARRYRAYLDDLIAALDDGGWDGDWYRRAYYDDGEPLGSAASDECRIDALAQAWAVLSGVAPPDRAERALEALEECLVDEPHGLIRLLTPPFDRTPHDPGYIRGYIPGVRENGGQYTHGVLWAVRALAEAGRADRAATLLEMLLPVNHALDATAVERYRVEPYVVAADVYGAAPHVGRGGWTWYTGSAAWMYRVALESILGLEIRDGARLCLRPCVPAAWPGYTITWRLPGEGTEYVVEVRRGGGPTTATLDGRELALADGVAEVPLDRDGGSHRVIVELGEGTGPTYRPWVAESPASQTGQARPG